MKQAPPPVSDKLTASALSDMRLKGGAMNIIYIGVDFHARQQTICYLKTETGELVTCELQHQDKQAVRAFYAQFPGPVVIGLEASGYSPWFEALLEDLGCEVWLGDATEIRRRARWRQKNDRRDAELILDLMVHKEFPRLHRPAIESREVLRMLRYRQKLIKIRTMSKNSLQALALQSGLAKGSRLFTKAGQQELNSAVMSPVMQWQCEHWLQLLQPLNQQLLETMVWLKLQSKGDIQITRLRTHPGIALPAAHAATSQSLSQCAESDGLCGLRSGGTFFSGAATLSGDQQSRLALAALSVGGSNAHRSQTRRGLKAFLQTTGRASRPPKGQGSGCQETTHPRLHHVA